MNAGFVKRFGAYVIDMILLSFLLSIIFSFLPQNERLDSLENEFLIETETAFLEGELSEDNFLSDYEDLSYEMAREDNFRSLLSIAITFIYFVGLQFYFGQTVGKWVLKIKVVGTKGKSSVWDLFLRSLFINNILFDLVLLISVFLFNSNVYYSINIAVGLSQFLFAILTINMILYRKDKRGLHDLIARTEVVRVERNAK